MTRKLPSHRERIQTYGADFLEHLNHLFLDGFLRPVARVSRTVLFFVLLFLYFITAVLLIAIQGTNWLALNVVAPNLRRQINSYLQEISLSSLIYILEWQCPIRFRVCFNSRETEYEFHREKKGLLVCNHQFQLDILFYYLCLEMCGHLGHTKAFAKSALRKMPIVGAQLALGDSIFVERNWDADQGAVEKGLDVLQSYKVPYLLSIIPEGTRFTKEKHELSVKYAREHGIEFQPEYHLLPRVKGFITTLRHMRKKDPNYPVYNVELLCEPKPESNDSYEPTIANLILGKPFKVDCIIEKVNPNSLPEPEVDESDEAYTKLLYDIYRRKDRLIAEHRQFNRFPQAVIFVRRFEFRRFLKFTFYNVLLTGGALFYLLRFVYIVSDSLALKLLVSSVIAAIYAALFVMMRMTMANSKYGERKRN